MNPNDNIKLIIHLDLLLVTDKDIDYLIELLQVIKNRPFKKEAS
jgi:hypothetical protein